MERKKVVNTFGGLDTDTSLNKYSPEKYIECKNFRTLLDGKNTNHALVNIKGNRPVAEFIRPIQIGETTPLRMPIKGIGEFDDSVIIFVKSGEQSHSVFFIPKNDLDIQTLRTYQVVGQSEPTRILTTKNFGLGNDPIKVICRKETNELQKVYFTDGNLPIQFFNAVNPDINTQNLNKFKMVPNATTSSIDLTLVSGSLRAGRVGYAYQLYNLYGAESHFSPVSRLLNIFDSPLAEKRRVKGNNPETVTSKGVTVEINDLDTSFDRIRLVRVLYEGRYTFPTIDVISEAPCRGTFIYTDIGLPGIDTYAVEEFNALLVEPIPKTMDSKNNYLFLGNIQEDEFDFTYESPRQSGRMSHRFGIKEYLLGNRDGAGTPHSTFTYELDNPDTRKNEENIGYQRGEKYRFGLVGYDEKLRPSFVKYYDDIDFPDYGDEGDYWKFNIAKVDWGDGELTYKRILHPKFRVTGLPSSVKYAQIVRAQRDTIRRSVIDVGYTGFLVPCKHLGGASHMFPGYPTTYRGVPYIYGLSPFNIEDADNGDVSTTDINLSLNHLEYTSPEILCNKEYSEKGSRLELLYEPAKDTVPLNRWRNSPSDDTQSTDASRVWNIRHDEWRELPRGDNAAIRFFANIEEAALHVNTLALSSTTAIGDVTAANTVMGIIHAAGGFEENREFIYPTSLTSPQSSFTLSNQDDSRSLNARGTRGTCMLLKSDRRLPLANSDSEGGTSSDAVGTNVGYGYLARRRKNIDNNGKPVDFYGDIETTEFAPCTEVLEVNGGAINGGEFFDVFGGDTYIGYFDYMRSMWVADLDKPGEKEENTLAINHSFVTETTVNIDLITSDSFNSLLSPSLRGTDWSSGGLFRLMQERRGTYITYDTEGLPKGTYNQDFDLYTFNGVYSREPNVRRFFTKPKDVIFSRTSPNRAYYSDKKVSGEFTDSWLKIRPLNFVDSDTRYGPITRLITFKDNLYIVQHDGVSMIPIEQRELLQTDTPGPLVVGTGDVAENPQYLSTESGSVDYYSIIGSRAGLYYYDRKNNKICRVEENINFISDSFSISSILRNRINSEVFASFDRKYNEILFSIFPGELLVFNEYKALFTGTHTYNFQYKVSSGENLYLTHNDLMYKTDDNDYGKFMDNINSSEITLVVNPGGNQMALYDIVELTLEMYEKRTGRSLPLGRGEEDIILNKPIKYVEIWNEWQKMDTIDLQEAVNRDDTSVVQRFRTWRLNTLVDNTIDEARLRSSSLYIKLIHDNTNNEKIILHDVVTNIRPTKLR